MRALIKNLRNDVFSLQRKEKILVLLKLLVILSALTIAALFGFQILASLVF